jgi:hypothetical protein
MYSSINAVTNIWCGQREARHTAYKLAGADLVHSKSTQTIRTPLYFHLLPYNTIRYRVIDTIVSEKARTAARPRCMSEFWQ